MLEISTSIPNTFSVICRVFVRILRCAMLDTVYTMARLQCTTLVLFAYPFHLFAISISSSRSSSSADPNSCCSLSFIFSLPSTLSFICAFSRRFCCSFFLLFVVSLFVFLCVALRSRFLYSFSPLFALAVAAITTFFILVCQSPPRRWPWTCSTPFCSAALAAPCHALRCPGSHFDWPVRPAPPFCCSQCPVGPHAAAATLT